jgi:hypothetical protein
MQSFIAGYKSVLSSRNYQRRLWFVQGSLLASLALAEVLEH